MREKKNINPSKCISVLQKEKSKKYIYFFKQTQELYVQIKSSYEQAFFFNEALRWAVFS